MLSGKLHDRSTSIEDLSMNAQSFRFISACVHMGSYISFKCNSLGIKQLYTFTVH